MLDTRAGTSSASIASGRLITAADMNVGHPAMKDNTPMAAEQVTYDPYGQPQAHAANWAPREPDHDPEWHYLHQGGRWNAVTGTYHFRHRELSTNLGRWIQQDPLRYVDGASVYQAVGSLPTSLLDPTGLEAVDGGIADVDGPIIGSQGKPTPGGTLPYPVAPTVPLLGWFGGKAIAAPVYMPDAGGGFEVTGKIETAIFFSSVSTESSMIKAGVNQRREDVIGYESRMRMELLKAWNETITKALDSAIGNKYKTERALFTDLDAKMNEAVRKFASRAHNVYLGDFLALKKAGSIPQGSKARSLADYVEMMMRNINTFPYTPIQP
jgi:RHS repeat-associated protein